MSRILIIEDEAGIARFVELELKHEGNEVEKAADGREGLDKALSGSFDLILLDVMLPGLNGMEVLRRLRQEKDTPVIMLTARDAVMDKVAGLDAGADDYITKPFGMMEFVARVKAVLRRCARQNEERELHCKDLRVNVARHEVSYQGELKELTRKEFELLEYLLENKGLVMSRNQILCHVWGYDFDGETRTVDVHIRSLRQKLGECGKLIETVRGIGYRIGGNE